jgi:protein involved in polysaccharide export with SLBB domain
VVLALLVPLSGCATATHDQLVAFLRSHEAEVASGSYVVRAPDVIAIHAPGAEEINGSIQPVRSDGKVVLRLLGEVDVAGLTPEEIGNKLEAQLSRYYVEPEVIVDVAGYNSQFFFVFGEVAVPGPRSYTGRDTLLMAIADAQPNFFAWLQQVRVTRPSPEGMERKTIVVDVAKMIRTGDSSENILLQEGDIIEVPPTPLAWVGHRVRELFYPLDPVLRAYQFPADVMDTTDIYRYGTSRNSSSNSSRGRWR